MPLFYDGMYVVGGKIRLNIHNGFRRGVLLHELKHHYCWKKEKYIGHGMCFKEPPLLPQGLVKDIVVFGEIETTPTCFDNVKNQNETDVDCGGPCGLCEIETFEVFAPPKTGTGIYILILAYFITIFIILYPFSKNETDNLNNKEQ